MIKYLNEKIYIILITYYNMGQFKSIPKVNFEDIQYAIRHNYILLHTFPIHNQKCLIKGSIRAEEEERIMNQLMEKGNHSNFIIIYGMNTNDNSVAEKYNKLLALGFENVYVYPGGLFEWLCLQDIYGDSEFTTTSQQLDILQYRPKKNFQGHLLMNQ